MQHMRALGNNSMPLLAPTTQVCIDRQLEMTDTVVVIRISTTYTWSLDLLSSVRPC